MDESEKNNIVASAFEKLSYAKRGRGSHLENTSWHLEVFPPLANYGGTFGYFLMDNPR